MGSPACAPFCRKACSTADSSDENDSGTGDPSAFDDGRLLVQRSKIHAPASWAATSAGVSASPGDLVPARGKPSPPGRDNLAGREA
jgi:hypothetical protein